ncbi:diguanylate cyclase (GGDEF)-like protein [Azospirillum lipoferum]|uniref:diguanylate cyclase n=1 Tax=Azospirillum lipoferum TaxID=193 RepID=A0A5A9GHY9_AZOLI|nr:MULTISPECIES: GGDEF domain-containing protein [Azospirillum]KAA0593957.1 GGDEF domain-containing protein [Azospirillum lipoferum]MCP1612432.1 diguanylate cyclase (GGDEF)-like protein [Azospirillum lipoferum]MDW5531784.1 GGDEF domain-containing protein [Azospirillum sp. NL1]
MTGGNGGGNGDGGMALTGLPRRWALRRGTVGMMLQEQKLQDWLARLACHEEYAGHPLMDEFRALADEHMKLMRQLTKIAKISDRMQTDTRQMARALHAASQTDPLTELPNRRHMIERLEAELCRVGRNGGGFALIMLDIDHFKEVNDAFGHAAGDFVLVETADLLRRNLRGHDLCARWGGEEFLILLPDADQVQAEAVAEKLRQLVAHHPIVHQNHGISVTLSLGVAAYHQGRSADACIQAADDALYIAKRAGRNRWAAAA